MLHLLILSIIFIIYYHTFNGVNNIYIYFLFIYFHMYIMYIYVYIYMRIYIRIGCMFILTSECTVP